MRAIIQKTPKILQNSHFFLKLFNFETVDFRFVLKRRLMAKILAFCSKKSLDREYFFYISHV